MSKEFYNQLGDELYNMKNSPFMRVGENGVVKNQSRQFVDKGGLSFDADRLFNPTKYKEKQKFIDDEYANLRKADYDEIEKIEYDLLRRNTGEEYKKQVEKMLALRRHDHKHPYSWFGVYRGICAGCDSCGEYEGCFSHGQGKKKTQIMQCIKCSCPMNSHLPIHQQNPFKSNIWKHLTKRDMKDEDIKMDHIVLAFKVARDAAHEHGSVIDLLKQISCHVKECQIETKLNFQLNLIRIKIIKDGVEKGYVESLLNLIDCIELQQQWHWETSKAAISEFYEELYEIIKKIALNLGTGLGEDDLVFTALCSYKIVNLPNLVKFLRAPGVKEQFQSFEFIWSSDDNKESLIAAQNFFKSNFQVGYQVFLLPSSRDEQQVKRNTARFKDILDFNKCIVFMEDLTNIDRVKFQRTFNQFNVNKRNYILGEEILNEKIKRVDVKLTAHIGESNFTIPFSNAPDFITVGQQNHIQRAMVNLYPQFSYSQRCVLIIRPFVLNANFEETIVNVLRINKFILLKRVKVKLSQQEAQYLATLENIADDKIPQYVEFMTAGVCEIVLVSKRSAIYEAYALTNGCLTGPSSVSAKCYREPPIVELKKGRQLYEYSLPISTVNNSQKIFQSLRETINLEQVLFGTTVDPQYATNVKTGEIIKISQQPPADRLQTSHKIKEVMLKAIRKDEFNYWTFTSKSQTLTEQIASIFLPECTLFEPITVIIKPGLTHLSTSIKRALMEHKYHIIVSKQVQMDKITAAEFVINCQKIKLPKEALKYIIDRYSSERVSILCLSKISGRKQIMSMLSGFSFLPVKNSKMHLQQQIISDELLCDMLVPVWNNEELCLSLIAQSLSNLEEAIKMLDENNADNQKSLMKKGEKFIVLDYLVGSFFGVSIQDLSLNTKIGKLSYYTVDDFAPKQQSWYYSQLSRQFPNYVPLLFQYRQIGQTMLCIQTDRGLPFMEMITRMYLSQMEKMEKAYSNDELRQNHKKKRRSLTLFLWAKKLSEFVLDLSDISTDLKGFGEIWEKHGEFQGNFTLDSAILQEQQFLTSLHKDLKDHREVRLNIKKLLDSRHLKQRYLDSSKRLLPTFSIPTIQQGIRVVEKTDTSKLHLMDKFSFIDPQNQNTNLKDLYALNLFNIIPEIKTKYSLAAELFYFIIRSQFMHSELAHMYMELGEIFTDLLSQVNDVEVLEYQIYLKWLVEFCQLPAESELKGWLLNVMKSYPNLRKKKKIYHDEVGGKKRKFLDHKQYFIRKDEANDEIKQRIEKKFMNFDLNTLNEPMKQTALHDPQDSLHRRLANPANVTNLLREEKQDIKRTGIYVEFQKNISEKEEMLKQKIKGEVEKFNIHNTKKEEILHETGLERNLWYRRSKGDVRETKESKVNTAIQKQIGKFIAFKESEKR